MVNYKNSKIYEIRCNITNNKYYGSTTQLLCKRKQEHKKSFKRWLENKKCNYYTSFEILKNGDYKFILVESFECDNKEQLLRREQYYIDNNECINKRRAIITQEQRIEYVKKYGQKYAKKYYETNKDKKKLWRENNNDIIKLRRRSYYLFSKYSYLITDFLNMLDVQRF